MCFFKFKDENYFKIIPLQDISSTTNGYSKENCIGKGNQFGYVYKVTSENHVTVRIKLYRGDHSYGDEDDWYKNQGNIYLGKGSRKVTCSVWTSYSFTKVTSWDQRREIILGIGRRLSYIHYGDEPDRRRRNVLLDLHPSYINLDDYNIKLFRKMLDVLSWRWKEQRLYSICIPRGLIYLHKGDEPDPHRNLHGDDNNSKIILNKAGFSDFGCPANLHPTLPISIPGDTLGYIDPEYFCTGHLTQKSDVYTFGIVLFEVLSGRLASDRIDGQFFFAWIQEHYRNKRLDKIIRSDLREQIDPASLLKFSNIAYQCLGTADKRPTMKNVVKQLQNVVKQLQKVVKQLQKALDNQLAPSEQWPDEFNVFTAAGDYDYAAFQHSHFADESRWKYDVFLSFRGLDTRMTFVKNLYLALVQQRVYKDDLILPGEPIGPSLYKAIEESKIAIVIFSENFADSEWCLDELEFIMKCRAEKGLVVIPVFYHVNPSEVRRQKGRYQAAFSKHESKNINKVKVWRKTLVDAANIAGFVVTWDEEKAIEQIVYTITHIYLSLIPSPNATAETSGYAYLIGIETRMQDLRSLLEIGSDGVRMVGICGIWGSGKSTISSSIYDDISHEFQGCCFIKNVSAESRMHGLKTLQEKILSDVFKTKVMLKSVKQGISMISKELRGNRVLIVLDDVNHIDHLKMLAGSHDWFGDGSRIIFNTRNQDLANAHSCITHNVRMLNDTEAIELFSRHAFGAGRLVEGYEDLLRSIVSKLNGHPSTIISLGCYLHDKDMNEWTSTLARLEGIPVDEILEKFNTGDDGVSRNTFAWFAS